MANRFDASSDSYQVDGLGAPHTLMAWVYLSVDTNSYSGMFTYNNGSQYFFGTGATGTRLNFFEGGNDTPGSELALATWYHVAIVAAAGGGGSRIAYLNGVQDLAATGDDITGGTLFVGNNSGGLLLNGRMAAVKAYSTTLTQAQIRQEMRQYLPYRTANLFAFWPLLTAAQGTIDFSGNAHPLTSNGTPTTEDGPPIPWSRGQIVTVPTVISPSGGGGGFFAMWEEIV